MTRVRTTCPYCGVGCGLVVDGDANANADVNADAEGGVSVAGDPSHPANFGRLCSKGAALAETLGLDGRLLHPLVAGERVAWDEALDLVAGRFARVIAEHGPGAIAFYVSGQLLTEDYYVANKLMKGFIGSANIDTNSRLCMASAVAGYQRALGADFVPCSYEDIETAELLVIVGANMAWCHPVLFQRARRAKEQNTKLRVVVVDPRRTATCDIADLHLAIRPGSDVVLFNGLLNYLRREDALDWHFLEAHTEGFADAQRAARESAGSIPAVAVACGVAEGDVAELYRLFARTQRTVTLFSQGVNQSTSGTDKVNAIINVHLATGRIGKPGAGPFSLTGQPNAMGGREVGGLASQLAAHMDFSAESVARLGRFWQSSSVATAPGLKAVELFDAIAAGRIKAVWIMSTNPAVSLPDADRVNAALERCEFVVVSDCTAATDTARCADVLLPAATWGEKSGAVTNSERRISRQRAFRDPPGESKPDWWIVCEVGKRMGYAHAFDYSSPAAIFREHAALSAFENDGARDFDIGGLAALTADEYDALEPIRWPVVAAADAGAGHVEPLADGRFFTASRKARFVATVPRPPADAPSAGYPFVLLTGRLRDQWHTMTRTGQSARLSQTQVEPVVQVHPNDAAQCGLRNGALAAIASRCGSMYARVETTSAMRAGDVFVSMHWSRQFASRGRVGSLIGAAVDPHSGQPELKHTAVALQPARPAWHAFALSVARLEIECCAYAVRSRGPGYWRYELADDADVAWPELARTLLGHDGDWIELHDAAAGRYRGARLVRGRLSGCLFAARDHVLPDRSGLGALFGAARTIDGTERASLLAGRPASPTQSAGPVICACFSVCRDTLVRAIRTQRLATAAEIGKVLRAGTSCGSCIPELNGLLEQQARA